MSAPAANAKALLARLPELVPSHARLEYDPATPAAAVIEVDRARVALHSAGTTPSVAHDVAVVFGSVVELDGDARADDRPALRLPLPASLRVCTQVIAEALATARACVQAKLADRLLEIGIALNAERDPARVLTLMLEHARSITRADAGSIYLVEPGGNSLRFKVAQNDSVQADFTEANVPVTDDSVVGACVRSGQIINLADLQTEQGSTSHMLARRFHHDRTFDDKFGYQTRSMLTTPMRPPGGAVSGVIQLINAKSDDAVLRSPEDFDTRVVAFSTADERLCSALAAQAAVALDNAKLYAEIQALFEGFVRASVHAIEQRDPTTSGHSQRVADLTVALAKAVDSSAATAFANIRFDAEELREIEYAGLLHDFGKVGVREQVLVKAKKLHEHQLERVMDRFEHMRTLVHLRAYEGEIERLRKGDVRSVDLRMELERRLQELDDMMGAVLEANEPAVLAGEASQRLMEVARVEYRDSRNRPVRLLDDDDVTALLVRRGSLTEAERVEIQNHVTHTYNFLVRIPWGQALRRVPEIAGKHHEYLDGSGYPHRFGAPQIPVQTRMMTIADIFDALTASDRPYKRAVPVEHALDILHRERDAGKIDRELLELFVGARVYETIGITRP